MEGRHILMRMARIDTETGPEWVLVAPGEGRWRRSGRCDPDAWRDLALCAARSAPDEPINAGRLLAPLAPVTFVGVGLNYRAHAAEQGRPLPAEPPLFLKNPRSVAPPVGPLPLHPASAALDYEAELGIVIGRPLFDATAAEAQAAIAGWLVVNDVTLRDLARPETLAIAKGGPGMAPLGPWITPVADLPVEAAGTLRIRCWVNGELRQDATTADMHFGPVELVQRIARHLPLGPGDVIASGSPGGSGVGFDPPRWLAAGDRLETEIEGLGRLVQTVVRNS
jgi:acylpyruvate hydrolase